MTTQAELIASVAKDAGVSQADAGRMLDALVKNIHKSLTGGGDVRISNLGVFDTAARAADLLAEEGYKVKVAKTGAEATEALAKDVPDLVMMDVKLPDQDGLTLLRELKRAHPELEVIVMTAFGGSSTAIKAMEHGAYDYIIGKRMRSGFAAIAWPVRYSDTGVMSFMVSHAGIVYEKDLGPNTKAIAEAMATFNPDPSWQKVPVP